MGSPLFSNFINDLSAKINSFQFLLFVDHLKIIHVIKSAEDYRLLQSAIDSVQMWCIETYTKINVFKINIILLRVN
jgi:hypothetical protein